MAGLGSGLPVSGGMSQSLVNETGGARTPLSGLVAALITLVVVLFFTGLLRNLPQPVLAAVVLMAVTGLIQVEALRSIWRFSRTEFAVAMAALFGVLAAGLLQGVLIGVAISILLLIGRAARPRVDRGWRGSRGRRISRTSTRHPENQREPDVLVVRPEGSLLYFNVDHVRDALKALVAERPSPPRLIVFFMGNVPTWTSRAPSSWSTCAPRMLERGIEFRLAETHGEVSEALRRLSHAHAAELAETNQTVDDVLNRWRAPPVS